MRPIDADVLLSQLEGILSDYTSRGLYPNGFTIESTIDAVVDMPTITAPTREQVERLRSRWVPLNNTQEHYCPHCGVAFDLYAYCKNDYQFCPACGLPMTDEAVDMVLERLEDLHGKRD